MYILYCVFGVQYYMVNWLSLMLEVTLISTPMCGAEWSNVLSSRCFTRCVCLHWEVFSGHVCTLTGLQRPCLHWQVFNNQDHIHWPSLMFHMTSDISAHTTPLWCSSSLHQWPAEYWHVNKKEATVTFLVHVLSFVMRQESTWMCTCLSQQTPFTFSYIYL